MLDQQTAGYEEIEHTADWELCVWGPTLPILLEQTARGMYALSHLALAADPRVGREFEIPFIDPESLLVDFLSELLFIGEDEGIAFDVFDLSFDGSSLRACLSGAPIEGQSKEIKAVTYHNLKVRQVENGLEVNIVFDV